MGGVDGKMRNLNGVMTSINIIGNKIAHHLSMDSPRMIYMNALLKKIFKVPKIHPIFS